jgi:NodT family efflux transporter outer membrane factor (OMF) lipoprotein
MKQQTSGRRPSSRLSPASRAATATLMAGLLAGCTLGPDFKAPEWAAPSSWFAPRPKTQPVASRPAAEPVDPDWWAVFRDPQLNGLMRRVAAENLDVRSAAIRLEESRSQLDIVRSAQVPTVNANASYARQQASRNGILSLGNTTSTDAANGASGNTVVGPVNNRRFEPFDIFQGGFDASWEIDLWGSVRRSVEAANASVDAAGEAQRDALVSAMAEVARDYIRLRGTQEQLRIAHDNLRIAQQSLTLTQQRAAGGVTTDLDVANASAQVRRNAAEIPAQEQQEAALINALSLLLGQPPQTLRAELETPKPVPPVPASVPVGVPSELVRRRPDIRQAEAQLHAATATIGVAEAAFYPSFTLSGSLGLQALQFGQLFSLNSRQYTGGPGITVPLFQGGQLRATLHLREAQQREAVLAWQRVLLQAWHEVDNALTAYQTEQARRAQLVRAVADSQRAAALAQSRYQQGVSDFLTVLDAERTLLGTQQQLAQSTSAVSENLVALYKALGGGWEKDLPRPMETAAAP